ncbi:MAG: hypothetical protein AAFR82_02870 [Pseudomonadota bacterium]
MHTTRIGLASLIALLASACAADSDKINSNLECAASISAVSQLAVKGELDTDAEFQSKSLYSLMTHLNKYAIPNGLREAEAFEQVNTLRDSMMETQTPSKLLNRAKSCIRKTPVR